MGLLWGQEPEFIGPNDVVSNPRLVRKFMNEEAMLNVIKAVQNIQGVESGTCRTCVENGERCDWHKPCTHDKGVVSEQDGREYFMCDECGEDMEL